MFPKIVVPPQIIHFNRVFHYKLSILGYPYFWKHPYIYIEKERERETVQKLQVNLFSNIGVVAFASACRAAASIGEALLKASSKNPRRSTSVHRFVPWPTHGGWTLKWWVKPQQFPWVFLLKVIILGCFEGTTISGNTHIFSIHFKKSMQWLKTHVRKGC